jgi:hypothetical protein
MKHLGLATPLLLFACSSQVSLGSQDDHVVTSSDEASVTDAATTNHPDAEASADAPSLDEHHPADASPDAAHYNGCAGKGCAVACTICDPHDTACVEPPGTKECNAHEQCVTAPVCP